MYYRQRRQPAEGSRRGDAAGAREVQLLRDDAADRGVQRRHGGLQPVQDAAGVASIHTKVTKQFPQSS